MNRFYPNLRTYYKHVIALLCIIFLHLWLTHSAQRDYKVAAEQESLRKLFYKAEKSIAPIFMGKCEGFLDPNSEYRKKIDTHFNQQNILLNFKTNALLNIESLGFYHLSIIVKKSTSEIQTNINGFYVVNKSNNKCFGLL